MFVFYSLLLRLFKVKNGIFFFRISFRIAIFTFMYYANEESDDIISGSIKAVQHSIDIKAVIFKHGRVGLCIAGSQCHAIQNRSKSKIKTVQSIKSRIWK